jgi:hypothetical protein
MNDMESNKWLWQPQKNGPIHIRLSYRTADDKRKRFVRSLSTNHWPTARKRRDKYFAPIVDDLDIARKQLEWILERFPDLERELHTAFGTPSDPSYASPVLETVYEAWVKAMSTEGGNYQSAPRSAKRYATIGQNFAMFVGHDKLIAAITSEDVTSYRDQRLTIDNRSKKSVDLELIALRGLFRFGTETQGLKENPADGVSVRRTKAERNRENRQHRRRPPSLEEADQLCVLEPAPGRRFTLLKSLPTRGRLFLFDIRSGYSILSDGCLDYFREFPVQIACRRE